MLTLLSKAFERSKKSKVFCLLSYLCTRVFPKAFTTFSVDISVRKPYWIGAIIVCVMVINVYFEFFSKLFEEPNNFQQLFTNSSKEKQIRQRHYYYPKYNKETKKT